MREIMLVPFLEEESVSVNRIFTRNCTQGAQEYTPTCELKALDELFDLPLLNVLVVLIPRLT